MTKFKFLVIPKAMKKMKEQYNLPDGRTTYSDKEYVTEWRKQGFLIANLLNGELHSFDPGFNISIKGTVIEVDYILAKKLIGLIEECQNLRVHDFS